MCVLLCYAWSDCPVCTFVHMMLLVLCLVTQLPLFLPYRQSHSVFCDGLSLACFCCWHLPIWIPKVLSGRVCVIADIHHRLSLQLNSHLKEWGKLPQRLGQVQGSTFSESLCPVCIRTRSRNGQITIFKRGLGDSCRLKNNWTSGSRGALDLDWLASCIPSVWWSSAFLCRFRESQVLSWILELKLSLIQTVILKGNATLASHKLSKRVIVGTL